VIVQGGKLAAATQGLEHVLRRARQLDQELRGLFNALDAVTEDLQQLGVTVTVNMPPLVAGALELRDDLVAVAELGRVRTA
jgi:hypothetical protein